MWHESWGRAVTDDPQTCVGLSQKLSLNRSVPSYLVISCQYFTLNMIIAIQVFLWYYECSTERTKYNASATCYFLLKQGFLKVIYSGWVSMTFILKE